MDRLKQLNRRLKRKVCQAVDVKDTLAGSVDYQGFPDVGVVQWLPFPGTSTTLVGERPPRELNFVGRLQYNEIMSIILRRDDSISGLIITGAKGTGKSVLLRAIGTELIVRSDESPGLVVICVWSLDAGRNITSQVQEFLLFAYSHASSETILEIDGIRYPDDVERFLESRKRVGDVIILLFDGEEKFDIEGRLGRKRALEEASRRTEARKWLSALQGSAAFVVKSLSPSANDALVVPFHFRKYELDGLFNEEEYRAFLKETVLGEMLRNHPEREETVAFYAGKHPMSLFYLNNVCEDHVHKVCGGQWEPEEQWRFGLVLAKNPKKKMKANLQQPEAYLDDKEEWVKALASFRRAPFFAEVRDEVKQYRGEVEALRDPVLMFTSYIVRNQFCTAYLYEVHLEAAMERVKRGVYRAPTFVAYMYEKLRKPTVVWPEIGWACEGFVSEAVMAVGLKLEDRTLHPSKLRGLHGDAMQLDHERWATDELVYLLPGKFSFKYVDGIIAYVDKARMVHIYAVQVIVSPETHRQTEYKFMLQSEVNLWCTGPCLLHYVYVCARPTGTQQGAPSAGMASYKRHEVAFSECFVGLGQEELELLQELSELREKEVERRNLARRAQRNSYQQQLASLPSKQFELLKLAKKQPGGARTFLNTLAEQQYGIQDPASYKNIYSLLLDMNV